MKIDSINQRLKTMTRSVTSILILFCLVASSWVSALSRESLPNRYVTDFDSQGIDSRVALALENQLVWGYIDNTGKYVIPPIYDSADAFWHECAEVTKDGKTFYIDHKGNQTANRQPSGGGSDADFKKIIFEKDIYDHTGKKMVARGALRFSQMLCSDIARRPLLV